MIALFAIPGAYIVIEVLRALPDTLRLFESGYALGFRIALFFLMILLLVAAIGAALLAVAWLLYLGRRVGRGLAYVVAGDVFVTIVLSDSRTTGQVVAAVACAVGVAILMFSPAVRDVFTGAAARDSDQPTSIVIARVLVVVVGYFLLLIAVLYFLAASIDSKYTVLGVLLVSLGVAAWLGARKLSFRDAQARMWLSLGAGAGIVLMLALGQRSTGLLEPIGLLAAIPVCLWLTPDARAWFGDEPIDLLATVTASGGPLSPRPSASPTDPPETAGYGHATDPHPDPRQPSPGDEAQPSNASVDARAPVRESAGPLEMSSMRTEPPPSPTEIGGADLVLQAALPSATCTHCGSLLSDDARFCPGCGTPRTDTVKPAIFCTRCGTKGAFDARFCEECGTQLVT